MADESSRSLKQIFQGMIPADAEIMQGIVISASPLKIQMVNDEKLIINERITIVPRHLSDYTTEATFTVGKGTLTSQTKNDGSHGGHDGGNGTHINHLDTFTLSHGTLTVYNALKKDDVVYVLAVNNGKLYYVFDRVVA